MSRSQYNYQTGQLLFIINQRMNVVRDLRNTITHLEAELERKQKHIKKQQQDYEEVIASLQAENEKLKQLLQGDSISHLPKEDQFLKEESQHGSVKKDSAPYASNTEWTDLVNENTFLRNEIVELSSTYQKQIDQLVFYFQKIKNENKRISPGHHAGQIKMMGNWIQACLKDFESEREKYDRKLMECGQTLDIYEKKFQEQNEYINQLRSLLQESEEKLKIVSRIHW